MNQVPAFSYVMKKTNVRDIHGWMSTVLMVCLLSVVEYSKRYSCGKFGSVSNPQETVDNFVDNI
ncbi:hypothetical protein IWT25_00337 [Secundilactobacillus pentosiphilus]|uniref:Uncharacterized protein n=1 Tax=Secundilactobacillus pentosiphilus TaxID=1714682 RepID=A0A1Z5ITD8_9LACO|nr:hypothetical protein IWT25_00337 [Secundilactobacillus pentosiphilus]